MNIDWSKAPVDATHYSPGGDDYCACWIKWVNGELHGWLKSNDTSWDRLPYQEKDPAQISLHVERPNKQEAWDGVGLPPVGTECEWKEKSGFQWVAATILSITDSSVVCKRSDGFEWQMPTKRTVFRPIKTAEQLAEEDRDKARTEVLNAMISNTMGFETEDQWQQRMKVVGEMLDMGYRKQ